MKLWCLFVVFLIMTGSISYIYSDDSNNKPNAQESMEEIPSKSPSSFVQGDRINVKRSQRNANILYRYCRHSGQAPQFCLKYAVRMIFATGH